ncbi:hypothetical protein BC834DRAFT_1037043 [Gloeopeniophorella convolvens]|nr:hypothetical protein BC834DRAFT_1037043 [Gloeopeniophorella convolvens]
MSGQGAKYTQLGDERVAVGIGGEPPGPTQRNRRGVFPSVHVPGCSRAPPRVTAAKTVIYLGRIVDLASSTSFTNSEPLHLRIPDSPSYRNDVKNRSIYTTVVTALNMDNCREMRPSAHRRGHFVFARANRLISRSAHSYWRSPSLTMLASALLVSRVGSEQLLVNTVSARLKCGPPIKTLNTKLSSPVLLACRRNYSPKGHCVSFWVDGSARIVCKYEADTQQAYVAELTEQLVVVIEGGMSNEGDIAAVRWTRWSAPDRVCLGESDTDTARPQASGAGPRPSTGTGTSTVIGLSMASLKTRSVASRMREVKSSHILQAARLYRDKRDFIPDKTRTSISACKSASWGISPVLARADAADNEYPQKRIVRRRPEILLSSTCEDPTALSVSLIATDARDLGASLYARNRHEKYDWFSFHIRGMPSSSRPQPFTH